LLVALDGGEHELNGPFGGQAFGLQGVGQAQTTHHHVGLVGQAAVELFLHVLAFAQAGACWQPSQLGGHVVAVQVRGANFNQLHAQLAVQKARQGDFEL
jgi:hypothetical protein